MGPCLQIVPFCIVNIVPTKFFVKGGGRTGAGIPEEPEEQLPGGVLDRHRYCRTADEMNTWFVEEYFLGI